MSRDVFSVELGYGIDAENGDLLVQQLAGAAVPGGDAGAQDDAPIGSTYQRTNGEFYTKIADANATADWELKSAGNNVIMVGYTPENGTVTVGDTYDEAFEKLDGNQQDIQTASGLAQGDVDYGTFTGDIITDNVVNKVALQELETELVDTRDNVDDLITLSGVAENSTDLGTFTGDTIPDASNNKEALQALETAIEAVSTDLGPADIAQNTATVVDSVLVDDCQRAEWEVAAHDIGTPANVQTFRISGFHNGHAGADATSVKDKVFDKSRLGGNFNLQSTVTVTGVGAAQVMNLVLETSDADGIRYSVKRLGCVAAL